MKAATASKRPNPFAPVFGATPDYVAGRRAELRQLGGDLRYIVECRQDDGRLPRRALVPIVLIGPRGVGKTLLLDWVEKQAKSKNAHVARLSHMEDLPFSNMLGRLAIAIAGEEDGNSEGSLSEMSFPTGAVEELLKRSWEVESWLKKMLKAKLKQQPVVFLLDEVQRYHVGYLDMLMKAVMELIRLRYPLMVVLAGTPGMDNILREIKTSFTIRGANMPINLLADEDVREGLEQPLLARGVEVDKGALAKMQSLTDGYPYFIQTVGDAVWRTLRDENDEGKRKRVDLPLVEKAIATREKKRVQLYIDLYNEMHDEKLCACALQIAKIFKNYGNQPVSRGMLEAGLKLMDKELLPDKGAREVVGILEDKGFLWPDAEGFLGPGIPSFLNFMEEMNAAEDQQREAIKKARDKQQRMLEGAEKELDLLDVASYVNADEAAGSKNLRIEIPLDLGEEWSIEVERNKIYTVTLPDGREGTYRVNRIEDHRDNPYRNRSSFTGIVLYLGRKIREGFDNTGMPEHPDVDSWKNKSSTRR